MVNKKTKLPFDLKKLKKTFPLWLSVVLLFFFAIAFIGLIGTSFYFYKESQRLKKLDTTKPLTLALKSPYDGLILDNNILTVKGTTMPNSTVVFYTETDENSVESDSNGNFNGTLSLQNGVNTLVVTVFSESGEEKSMVVDVVYENNELNLSEDNIATESSIQGVQITKKSEDTTNNKEKENQGKSQEKKEDKQAIVGNVDKITGNSLIITDKKGKKKVKTSIDNNTPIVGKDNKELKIKNLKSKDRTAIVTQQGIATKSPRLNKALKVFHKEATFSAQLKRRAVQGVVISISGNSITLAHQIHRERHYNIFVIDSTEYKLKGLINAALTDLQVSQRIIAIGDIDEQGNITAKRIHIIPGKATGIFKKQPVATISASPTSTSSAEPQTSPPSTQSALLKNLLYL